MRLTPTLAARSYFGRAITNLVAGAQFARMRDGLRLAGIRDHADEDANSGVASDGVLHTDYEAPTPTQVPGATTIRTPDLAALVEHRRPLLLDASPWNKSISGAVGLMGGGIGGSIDDEYQGRLARKVRQLTDDDKTMPIVTIGFNSERYQGRNLALRLVALGYTNVY
jgi:hypothetical protein